MRNKPIEYERWKTDIPLASYAASCGYELDKRKSSRTYTVMWKGGEKLIIRRGTRKNYWVFNQPISGRHGTIVDLAAQHLNVSLNDRDGWTAVCAELRSFAGSGPPPGLPLRRVASEKAYDLEFVRREWEAACTPTSPTYLTRCRAISMATLRDERFVGRWRQDRWGRFLFPHFDEDGLCGFERKGRRHTGFATGGKRGLFCTQIKPDDNRLAFADATLDLMSYHELRPHALTRYMSTGGDLSPNQVTLVSRAILRMPRGATILSLFDNDPAGDKMTDTLRRVVAAIELCAQLAGDPSPGYVVAREVPPIGKDWNEFLQRFRRASLSSSPVKPPRAPPSPFA